MSLKGYFLLSLVGLGILFSGCATTNLQTQAKMTRSIFIEPVRKDKRTVFISIKNTSGQDIHLQRKIADLLREKGYRVIDDPEAAKFILMANVLFANNLREANAANAAVAAGTAGAIAGSFRGGTTGLVTGLTAAAIGGIAGKITEDEIFRMVVDILIREKTSQKVITTNNTSEGQANISEQKRAGFLNSFAGPVRSNDGAGKLNDNIQAEKSQKYATNYIEKKTRIFAEAIKMNFSLEEAMPILEEKISKSIAGIF